MNDLQHAKNTRASGFQFSIKTLMILAVVIAAFSFGRRLSKNEIVELKRQLEQSQLVTEQLSIQVDGYRKANRTLPTVDEVMQAEAYQWPNRLRSRLQVLPEHQQQESTPIDELFDPPR